MEKFIASLLGILRSKEGGVLSVLKNGSNKFSFRRSIPVLLITSIVVPDFTVHGLSWHNVTICVIACITYIIPSILDSFNKKG